MAEGGGTRDLNRTEMITKTVRVLSLCPLNIEWRGGVWSVIHPFENFDELNILKLVIIKVKMVATILPEYCLYQLQFRKFKKRVQNM